MSAKREPKVHVSLWLTIIESILVRYVKMSDEWLEQVRDSAKRGPVVFLLRNRSLIDFLCVRGLCRRYGLPTVGFVSGLAPFIFLPLWRFILVLFRRRLPDRQRQRLIDTFEAGGSAVVFLRRPALRGAVGSRPVKIDGVRLAVEAQEILNSPVQALPAVFLWGESAMRRMPRTVDFVLGTSEYPRLLRSIWLLMRRRSTHGAWVAEPIDLSSVRGERGVDNEALAGIVRAGVGRQIEKIRRRRLGTLKKPSSRIKEEVVMSGRLRSELTAIADDEGFSHSEIEPRTRSIIDKMATHFRPRVLTFFGAVMAFVWRRIYTGFDIPEGDLERVRKAVGQGATLILPTHKSHIDYLAVSQVMSTANIMLPHIAAGENLSFWPMGWLFRSSGAFFIRRKFINDRFYTAVVNAYIRRLLQEGYAIEVFIEGGRSRSGKLLRPKLGMLEMALRATAVSPRTDPGVLPVFLGYEKVIEEGAYVRESEGKKKQAESVGGIIKSTKVLLHRYGRLAVRVGAHFTVQQILDEMGHKREDLLQGNVRREVALEISMRTLHEINRITVATPSSILATAALTMESSRFSWSELRKTTFWLTDFLKKAGVAMGKITEQWASSEEEERRTASCDRTISAFVKAGRIRVAEKADDPTLMIKEGQRLPLDYYKNNLVHFFVPSSFIATTCLGGDKNGVTRDEIAEDFTLSCRLYRWEFLLPEYSATDNGVFRKKTRALLDPAIDHLIEAGILFDREKKLGVGDIRRAKLLRDILRNFHEAYYATLHVARTKAQGEVKGETIRLSRSYVEKALTERRFIKSEGMSRLNIQNAFATCKDLKINRPADGERPYDKGELGDRLIKLLEKALSF